MPNASGAKATTSLPTPAAKVAREETNLNRAPTVLTMISIDSALNADLIPAMLTVNCVAATELSAAISEGNAATAALMLLTKVVPIVTARLLISIAAV